MVAAAVPRNERRLTDCSVSASTSFMTFSLFVLTIDKTLQEQSPRVRQIQALATISQQLRGLSLLMPTTCYSCRRFETPPGAAYSQLRLQFAGMQESNRINRITDRPFLLQIGKEAYGAENVSKSSCTSCRQER